MFKSFLPFCNDDSLVETRLLSRVRENPEENSRTAEQHAEPGHKQVITAWLCYCDSFAQPGCLVRCMSSPGKIRDTRLVSESEQAGRAGSSKQQA